MSEARVILVAIPWSAKPYLSQTGFGQPHCTWLNSIYIGAKPYRIHRLTLVPVPNAPTFTRSLVITCVIRRGLPLSGAAADDGVLLVSSA